MPFSPNYILFSSEYAPGILNLSAGKDILTKVTSDRIFLCRKELADLISLARERTILNENLQSKTDDRICTTVNCLLEQESIHKPNPNIKCSLGQQLNDLYRVQIQEELSFWNNRREMRREIHQAEKQLNIAMLDLWMIQFLKR